MLTKQFTLLATAATAVLAQGYGPAPAPIQQIGDGQIQNPVVSPTGPPVYSSPPAVSTPAPAPPAYSPVPAPPSYGPAPANTTVYSVVTPTYKPTGGATYGNSTAIQTPSNPGSTSSPIQNSGAARVIAGLSAASAALIAMAALVV